MDHVADEVHEQPQEVVTGDVCADAQDFPGGLHDTLVFTNYVHHVTATVWVGKILIS